MPTIRRRVSSTTTDALNGQNFKIIPSPGAILNMWIAGVTATDNYGLTIGDRQLIANGTTVNIEASADVIDTDRDQVLFNEVVGPGELFLPVTVTTEAQFLLHIRYL